MSSTLPDLLDPWRAIAARAEFAGTLPLSRFSRLRDGLSDTGGELRFRLVFSRDSERRGVILGEIGARLSLVCQRCMGSFDHDVDSLIELAIVSGLDEARGLPERYDPLLVTGDPIRPADVLEDELLLALPQIPMHPLGACDLPCRRADVDAASMETGEVRPFSALAEWNRKS